MEKQVMTKEACLSFLKGKRFECVDRSLNESRSFNNNNNGKAKAKGKKVVCGTSPHLSTFAILLATSSSTECGDNDVYFWVAIGLILGVCLFCAVLVVLEWRVAAVKALVLGEE